MLGESKKQLRTQIKKLLETIPSESKKLQSTQVTSKALNHHAFLSAKRVSIFLSTDKEIDTNQIVKEIFNQNKTCFIPKIDMKSTHMDMVLVNSFNEIETLPVIKYGLRQPATVIKEEEAIESGGLDLVFIPGLAFDTNGNRLGHGKGYYDQFLHRYKKKYSVYPHTIALAFREQLVESVPIDNTDVPVNEILISD